MTEHSIPIKKNYFAVGQHDYDVARALCRDIMTQPSPPTAIFAMSDIQALGCIASCRELGMRIPDDISVIGYDDLEMSYHTELTTVRQYLDLSGRVTIEYLIQHLKGETKPPAPLPLPEVITRRTTGVPRRIAVQAASRN